jgi:hypothetical protein
MTMRGWLVLGTVAVGLVARAAGAATPIDPATLVGGGGPPWNAKAKYRAPTFSVKMKIRLPGKIAKTTILLAKQQ